MQTKSTTKNDGRTEEENLEKKTTRRHNTGKNKVQNEAITHFNFVQQAVMVVFLPERKKNNNNNENNVLLIILPGKIEPGKYMAPLLVQLNEIPKKSI